MPGNNWKILTALDEVAVRAIATRAVEELRSLGFGEVQIASMLVGAGAGHMAEVGGSMRQIHEVAGSVFRRVLDHMRDLERRL